MRVFKLKFIALFAFVFPALGANAESIDLKGMESAEEAYKKRVSKEVVAYMSLETMFPDKRVRALAEAAGKGKTKKVADLFAQGVDVNARGAGGATPLFWALRNINFEGFEKLLELGADPNIRFADGSVMHWCARLKDIAFLKEALRHGGDANLAAGQFGETPLFKAIRVDGGDNKVAIRLLLDAGADINAVTGGDKVFGISMGGRTPIMAAADANRYDVVYELLILGADFQGEDDIGRSLMYRVKGKNGRYPAGSKQAKALSKVISWLSERGASISN